MRPGKVLFLTLLVVLLGGHVAGAATVVVTTTIQAAIDSVYGTSGNTIVIPAGNYNEKIVIDGFYDMTITGAGPGVTTIDGTGLTGTLITVKGWGSKFTLKNLTVDGAGVMTANIMMTEQTKTATIMNCEIKNAVVFGLGWENADKVTVKNCLVQDNFGGIVGGNCYNSKILSSTVMNNAVGIAIGTSHNTLIKANLIMDNTVGLGVTDAQKTEVQQNVITGSTNQAIQQSNPNYNGNFGNIYSKNRIQFNPGDGVYVLSGFPTFIGNLITDNGGVGFGSDSTTGTTYSTLMKNAFNNNAGGSSVGMLNSSGYLAKNNISASSYGIAQQVTVPVMMSNILTLMGNKIIDTNIGVFAVDSTGIGIVDAVKNFIVDNPGGGVGVGGHQGIFLEKNKVAANGSVGIATAAGQATLNKNLVYANGDHGIASAGIFSVIYKNKVNGNNGSGIMMTDFTHVDGNKVLGNTQHGIDGSASANSLIENNKALGNGDGATYFDLYDDGPNNVWLNNKINTYSLP